MKRTTKNLFIFSMVALPILAPTVYAAGADCTAYAQAQGIVTNLESNPGYSGSTYAVTIRRADKTELYLKADENLGPRVPVSKLMYIFLSIAKNNRTTVKFWCGQTNKFNAVEGWSTNIDATQGS